jgi:hypothetical protein
MEAEIVSHHEQIVSGSRKARRATTRLLPRPREPQEHETADHGRGNTYHNP